MHTFVSEGCQLWQHVVTVTSLSQLGVEKFRFKPRLAPQDLARIVVEDIILGGNYQSLDTLGWESRTICCQKLQK